MTATLLVEIGLEELPPKAMQPLAEAFGHGVAQELAAAGIAHGAVTILASPRRLAVSMAQTAAASAEESIEKFGPAINIAFDGDGHPTKAGEGFARSVGAGMDELTVENSDKGQRLVYRGTAPGQPLATLLQSAVDNALKQLPIPKRMRWGATQHAFVRPVHWLVALHGTDVLPITVFDEQADRLTQGHRFHASEAISLRNADDYVARLKDPGHVLVDPQERRARVVTEVKRAADTLDATALMSDELIDEVAALVEWPAGIAGRFDERFLVLPREVLISTLEVHQRYFPVNDAAGHLQAGFVTVANIESRDPAQVVAGNERVVRPRLADALFFWEQDQRKGLSGHVDRLARVSFQQSLGSLADKSQRIGRIAAFIAPATTAPLDAVARAATLAKTDLLTEMVDEFPDLQGVMGRYYALNANENPAVADALAEQYAPASAGAPIAPSPVGQTIALADRLDTLAGIFAIGKRPSGDKDPFALRRAALGVLRTLIEGHISLDLAATLRQAIAEQPVQAQADTESALWMFHMERLRGYYQERDVPGAYFEAVVANEIGDMTDFNARIEAVGSFMRLPDAVVVCGAHKRIRNILRKNADTDQSSRVDYAQLMEPAEQTLASALDTQTTSVDHAMRMGDYATALTALASLATPLDQFFSDVMVMTEDSSLRTNRLALLASIDTLCRQVADISCLSPE